MIAVLLSWLSNEQNHRLIESVGTILEIFGLIIPGFIGIVSFISANRRRERDEILLFLFQWTSPERNKYRIPGVFAFEKFKRGEISFEDISGVKYYETVSGFMNENEYMALFVAAEGLNSYRARLAREQLSSVVAFFWSLTETYVRRIRDKDGVPTAYIAFERLALHWQRSK